MKFFKWKTWKTLVLGLALLVSIVITANNSLAYFTDSKEMTNVFTSGNVYISLSESAVKADAAGNLVKDPDEERIFGTESGFVRDYGNIYPGQTIFKDPTITNTGDDEAWIAAKVIITDGAGDIHNVMGYELYDDIDIEILLQGGLLDEQVQVDKWNGNEDVCYNDNYAMVQVAERANGTYEFFFFMLAPQTSGAEVVLFDTMALDPEWGYAEMKEFSQLEIKIQAFAVQTFGFSSCLGAMKAAFSSHFSAVAIDPAN